MTAQPIDSVRPGSRRIGPASVPRPAPRPGPGPGQSTVDGAITLADCAPTLVHDRPWQWRTVGDEIELHADPSAYHRDPYAMTVSCGAALHNLRTALAAFGWLGATVPGDGVEGRLAVLRLRPHQPGDDEMAAVSAIGRHHGRWRRSTGQVRDADLRALASVAVRAGVVLTPSRPPATGPATEGARLLQLAIPAARRVIRLPLPRTPDHDTWQAAASGAHERWCTLAAGGNTRAALLATGEALGAVAVTAPALGVLVTPWPTAQARPAVVPDGMGAEVLLRISTALPEDSALTRPTRRTHPARAVHRIAARGAPSGSRRADRRS